MILPAFMTAARSPLGLWTNEPAFTSSTVREVEAKN